MTETLTWRQIANRRIAKARRVVREQADNPNAWLGLAMVLEDAWRDQEARDCYVKALALSPDDKTLLLMAQALRGFEHAPQLKKGRRPSGPRPNTIRHLDCE